MLRGFQERVTPVRSVLARGSHPLPDDESVKGGRDALALAREAREADAELVLLLSGGASAMLAAPAPGVSLDVKREITRRLLAVGAAIHDLNAVRKHLSQIKGGRLALDVACTTFALSDVTDDDPASIGSGPPVADPSTMADAKRVLERAGIARDMPEATAAIEQAGESPKPGDPRLSRSRFVLIGGRRTAMDGVVDEALARGLATIVFDEPITGDASAAGAAFARRAIAAAERIGGTAVVIASGETTVHVRGGGTGGRNQEFALGAVVGRDFSPGLRFALAAAGTDGVDGNSPAAGAIVDGSTLARARDAGLDPRAALAANDTSPFFERLGDRIMTGPTGTNVGDVYIALVG
jgi:glycerate 2-kinase